MHCIVMVVFCNAPYAVEMGCWIVEYVYCLMWYCLRMPWNVLISGFLIYFDTLAIPNNITIIRLALYLYPSGFSKVLLLFSWTIWDKKAVPPRWLCRLWLDRLGHVRVGVDRCLNTIRCVGSLIISTLSLIQGLTHWFSVLHLNLPHKFCNKVRT